MIGQVPVFVESKDDTFYFVLSNPEPSVTQNSVELNAKSVDFDNLTYSISKNSR